MNQPARNRKAARIERPKARPSAWELESPLPFCGVDEALDWVADGEEEVEVEVEVWKVVDIYFMLGYF